MPGNFLTLTIRKKYEENIRKGAPWILAEEIMENSSLSLAEPGELVRIQGLSGSFLGIGYYNPLSYIACRILSRDAKEKIDAEFFAKRLAAAREKRERLFPGGYYRLIHSEADGLPGLVIDCFGDAITCQISTAGMERLKTFLVAALETTIAPKTIIFRNDVGSRLKEGLAKYISVEKGEPPEFKEVHENDATYFADLLHGQKTGWFYDQRNNRAFIAQLAKGKTVLDCYCHSGGFGILAAKNGAKNVTFLDSSAPALKLAKLAAEKNSVMGICDFIRGKAFDELERIGDEGRKFDMVLLDPPAFVKTRGDKKSGMMGYERLINLGLVLVEKGGILALTSCSHHAPRSSLRSLMEKTITVSGRNPQLLKSGGAAPDHPKHPKLPESDYLKFLVFKVA